MLHFLQLSDYYIMEKYTQCSIYEKNNVHYELRYDQSDYYFVKLFDVVHTWLENTYKIIK